MMAVDRTTSMRVLSEIELEELLAAQKLNRGVFWRLLPLLKPVKKLVLGAVVLEILLVFFVFLRPFFIQKVIDKGIIYGESSRLHIVSAIDWYVITLSLLGLALTWAARFFIAGFSQFLSGSAAIQVLNQLRVTVFSHVQHLSVGYFDRTKAGRIVTRVDRDVEALEPLLIQGPPEVLSAILRFFMAGGLLYWASPALFFGLEW
jgi:ATP-binding cassette subfamily B protein